MESAGVTDDGPEEEERSFNFSLPTPDVCVHVHGVTFHLNKRCMASKSAKFAQLSTNTNHTFADMPTDCSTFSLVADFCHGRPWSLTASNVAPVACLTAFLEMTEDHSPGNLLDRCLTFMYNNVLPHWNETIKAYKSIESIMERAEKLGLLQVLLDSIAEKVVAKPCLLMNPMEASSTGEAKRRLLMAEWGTEDLTSLKLHLFVMAMMAVAQAGLREDQVAQCLYRYVKKRAPAPELDDGVSLVYKKNRQIEVIEATEKLLPRERGSLHVKCLFEMLRSALYLQASVECRNGLEQRIARQLAEAKIEDLILPSYGYTSDAMHDFECVRRILNHFCSDFYSKKSFNVDESELMAVSELVEDFLPVAAKDPDLKKETFTSLLGMLVAMLHPLDRIHDKAYHAVDVYLRAHGHMTESEREDVCRALDVRRMSMAACEHATLNERMPIRKVAQVLFMGNLRMKEAIAEAMMDLEEVSLNDSAGEAEEEKEVVAVTSGGGSTPGEMEDRVRRLEEECGRMREEIEKRVGCGAGGGQPTKRKRWSWMEMRWRLGCGSGIQFRDGRWKRRKVDAADKTGGP